MTKTRYNYNTWVITQQITSHPIPPRLFLLRETTKLFWLLPKKTGGRKKSISTQGFASQLFLLKTYPVFCSISLAFMDSTTIIKS